MTTKILTLNEVQEIESELLRIIDEVCKEEGIPYYLVCGSALGAIRHKGPIPWDNDVDITIPLPQMSYFSEMMKKRLANTKYQIAIPGETENKDSITTFPRVGLKGSSIREIHVDVFPQIGICADKDEQERFTKRLTAIKTRYRNKRVAYTNNGPLWKRVLKKTMMKGMTVFTNEKRLLEEFYRLCNTYPYDTATYVTNPCGHYGTKNIVPKDYFGTPKRVPYLDMELPVPEKTEEYLTHYYKDYTQFPPEKEIRKMMNYMMKVEEY